MRLLLNCSIVVAVLLSSTGCISSQERARRATVEEEIRQNAIKTKINMVRDTIHGYKLNITTLDDLGEDQRAGLFPLTHTNVRKSTPLATGEVTTVTATFTVGINHHPVCDLVFEGDVLNKDIAEYNFDAYRSLVLKSKKFR